MPWPGNGYLSFTEGQKGAVKLWIPEVGSDLSGSHRDVNGFDGCYTLSFYAVSRIEMDSWSERGFWY